MSFVHDQVAARLRTLITAAGVATVITEPDVETLRESFLVDFTEGTWEFPRMKGGAVQPLRTEFNVRVGIEVHTPGATPETAQARYVVLANAVMTVIRTDPTLQATGAITGLLGVTGSGSMRGPFTGRLPDGSGWSCVGDITIPVRTDAC